MTATAAPLTCGTCGAELGLGALFCVGCGTAVPREQRVAARAGRPPAWFERDDNGSTVTAQPEPELAPTEPEHQPQPELHPEREPTEQVTTASAPPAALLGLSDAEANETTADIPRIGHPRTVPDAAGPVAVHDIAAPPPVPEERQHVGAPVVGESRASVSRRGSVLSAIMVVAVVLVGALLWVLARSTAPNTAAEAGAAVSAVSAWRAGNAAWAKGEVDAVCDRFDGVGAEGMWRDRATCVKAEREGYAESTERQRASLEAMTLDPKDALVLADDLVVILYRDARVDGERPPYFTEADFAVMRRLGDQGWRQVGVRYGGDVVGNVPPAVLRVAPPVPTSTPSPT